MPITAVRANYYFIAAGLLLSAIVLVYIFFFLEVSLAEAWRLCLNADLRWLLIFVVLSLAGSFCRVWRYSLLLAASGVYPRTFPLYLVILVRNTFSDLLPARLGSLVYVFLATTRLGIPLPLATSSFALALVFDVISIVPLLIASLMLIGTSQYISQATMLVSAAVILLLGIGCLAALPGALRFSAALLDPLEQFGMLSQKLRAKLQHFITAVLGGISDARQHRIYFKLFILSLFVRLGKYLGLYALLLALIVPLGYSIQQLPFPTVFLAQLAAETGASMPISGPMGVGGYQAGWILMFTLLGFPPDLVGTTSVAHHAASQLWGYGIGLCALLVLLLPFLKTEAELLPQAVRIDSSIIFSFKIAQTLALVGALCIGLYFSFS